MILPYACACGHTWNTDWDEKYSQDQNDSCPKCDTMCAPDETRRIFELSPFGWLACHMGEEAAKAIEVELSGYMSRNRKSIVYTALGLAFCDDIHFGKRNNKENN